MYNILLITLSFDTSTYDCKSNVWSMELFSVRRRSVVLAQAVNCCVFNKLPEKFQHMHGNMWGLSWYSYPTTKESHVCSICICARPSRDD